MASRKPRWQNIGITRILRPCGRWADPGARFTDQLTPQVEKALKTGGSIREIRPRPIELEPEEVTDGNPATH